MLVEVAGDLGMDVIVEKLIDDFKSSTMLGGALIYCANDFGFSVVSVSVLPLLKRQS